MTPRHIIQKKRDGEILTDDEIAFFVRGYMRSLVTDYHMAALLMAIYLRGMTRNETLALTREMRDSGKVLDLSSIPGKKIDKHSTGGVGDKTSLIIAPIVAACGVVVPMITGRALGHTGGTLDKLQSIPGFDPHPTPLRIVAQLREIGAVIMGQTDDIAPVDRRMYALRDVTGTVESIPLITASIVSKKVAEGIDGLVMDVKTGSGAFMPDLKTSSALGESIAAVCHKLKTKSVVVISDMDQPLGKAIGNALEVQECIDCLNGKASGDLLELCIALSAHMIHLSGRAPSVARAARMAREAVAKGDAAKRFREIIRMQGGCERVMDDSGILPKASHVQAVKSAVSGFITRCDARSMGLASNALGAGRLRIDDTIDPAVGIYLLKKVGDKVSRGEPLCEVHWNDESRLRDALSLIKEAYEIKSRALKPRPLIQ